MRKYGTKLTETQTLEDVICDCCGNSCIDKLKMNYEFATLMARWGYGSHHDTETWNCDLCEDCAVKVREFIEKLGGKINVTNYM